MNYPLDKKTKKNKSTLIIFSILIFLILIFFRSSVWNGLSLASHAIFRPILISGNSISEKFSSIKYFFVSKNSLYFENENLKFKLSEQGVRMANYNSVLTENLALKEILGRKGEKQMTLSAILSKPNQSLYDTLVIDAGAKEGLQIGDTVFALGNIPIGRIAEIHDSFSKVILFSNSGEKTQVVISDANIFTEIVGRGGGNFEMITPADVTLLKDDQVVLPGINPYVLAIVQTIISDPRDSLTKAILTSPINIQELKFVEVTR